MCPLLVRSLLRQYCPHHLRLPLGGGAPKRRRARFYHPPSTNNIGGIGPASLTQSSPRFDRRFDVYEITKDGERYKRILSIAEVLRRFGVHARDVISLGLHDKQYSPPPAILPRGNVIIVALGNYKALIYSDVSIIFDARRPVVEQASADLLELIKVNFEEGTAERAGDDVRQALFRSQGSLPFELAVLEAMLQELCDSFSRRQHILRRMVHMTLRRAITPDSRIEFYKLVPINVALKNFELSLQEARQCIEVLLKSDQDMSDLLLTEKERMPEGSSLPIERHDEVELLLENYHRQLLTIQNTISELTQEVHSTQKLLSINLDLTRNKLIRVDIQLATLNLGVATAAGMFGAYGMNVLNGFEETAGAFPVVVGSALVGACAIYLSFFSWVRSSILDRRLTDQSESDVLDTITKCLKDVDSIETVMRSSLALHVGAGESAPGSEIAAARPLDRQALKELLSKETGREVRQSEVDFIFKVMDHSQDGWIGAVDWRALMKSQSG